MSFRAKTFSEYVQGVLKKGEGVLEKSLEFQRQVIAVEIDPDGPGPELWPEPPLLTPA
jgi:hypothetical protein|tara:strand:- start:156 stop:329 length:174 start_codon:yes stop_codon:yes gene_type:complete